MMGLKAPGLGKRGRDGVGGVRDLVCARCGTLALDSLSRSGKNYCDGWMCWKGSIRKSLVGKGLSSYLIF